MPAIPRKSVPPRQQSTPSQGSSSSSSNPPSGRRDSVPLSVAAILENAAASGLDTGALLRRTEDDDIIVEEPSDIESSREPSTAPRGDRRESGSARVQQQRPEANLAIDSSDGTTDASDTNGGGNLEKETIAALRNRFPRRRSSAKSHHSERSNTSDTSTTADYVPEYQPGPSRSNGDRLHSNSTAEHEAPPVSYEVVERVAAVMGGRSGPTENSHNRSASAPLEQLTDSSIGELSGRATPGVAGQRGRSHTMNSLHSDSSESSQGDPPPYEDIGRSPPSFFWSASDQGPVNHAQSPYNRRSETEGRHTIHRRPLPPLATTGHRPFVTNTSPIVMGSPADRVSAIMGLPSRQVTAGPSFSSPPARLRQRVAAVMGGVARLQAQQGYQTAQLPPIPYGGRDEPASVPYEVIERVAAIIGHPSSSQPAGSRNTMPPGLPSQDEPPPVSYDTIERVAAIMEGRVQRRQDSGHRSTSSMPTISSVDRAETPTPIPYETLERVAAVISEGPVTDSPAPQSPVADEPQSLGPPETELHRPVSTISEGEAFAESPVSIDDGELPSQVSPTATHEEPNELQDHDVEEPVETVPEVEQVAIEDSHVTETPRDSGDLVGDAVGAELSREPSPSLSDVLRNLPSSAVRRSATVFGGAPSLNGASMPPPVPPPIPIVENSSIPVMASENDESTHFLSEAPTPNAIEFGDGSNDPQAPQDSAILREDFGLDIQFGPIDPEVQSLSLTADVLNRGSTEQPSFTRNEWTSHIPEASRVPTLDANSVLSQSPSNISRRGVSFSPRSNPQSPNDSEFERRSGYFAPVRSLNDRPNSSRTSSGHHPLPSPGLGAPAYRTSSRTSRRDPSFSQPSLLQRSMDLNDEDIEITRPSSRRLSGLFGRSPFNGSDTQVIRDQVDTPASSRPISGHESPATKKHSRFNLFRRRSKRDELPNESPARAPSRASESMPSLLLQIPASVADETRNRKNKKLEQKEAARARAVSDNTQDPGKKKKRRLSGLTVHFLIPLFATQLTDLRTSSVVPRIQTARQSMP